MDDHTHIPRTAPIQSATFSNPVLTGLSGAEITVSDPVLTGFSSGKHQLLKVLESSPTLGD